MSGRAQREEERRVEQSETQGSTVARRKRTTAERNQQRDRKRGKVTGTAAVVNQRALHMIVGVETSQVNDNSLVPWEHRCILGQTRGAGETRSIV